MRYLYELRNYEESGHAHDFGFADHLVLMASFISYRSGGLVGKSNHLIPSILVGHMKGSDGDRRSTNLKSVLHNRIAMAGSLCYTFQEHPLADFASIFHFNKSSHQHHCQLIHGALAVTNLGCEIRKRIGKYQVFERIPSQGFNAILQVPLVF